MNIRLACIEAQHSRQYRVVRFSISLHSYWGTPYTIATQQADLRLTGCCKFCIDRFKHAYDAVILKHKTFFRLLINCARRIAFSVCFWIYSSASSYFTCANMRCIWDSQATHFLLYSTYWLSYYAPITLAFLPLRWTDI